MKRALRNRYAAMKREYLSSLGYDVPDRYASSFVHWGGGVEAQYILSRLTKDVPRGGRVLIVGVMGGRDYYLFRNLGYEVEALDIGPQPDIEPITFGNIEDELPYPPESFDVVLVGEVLEHLERDVQALRHVRDVLKPEGRLIVTVPFFNDWEEGHTRIHSPASIVRLLALGGFTVVDYVERPALLRPNSLNPLQHALNLLVWRLRGRTAYALTGRAIGAISWSLGRKRWLSAIRRKTRGYGAYLSCVRGPALDHVDLNRRLYTSAPPEES